MSRFGAQYQVSRPTGRCAHSGEVIEPGSLYVAALRERPEDEALERVDYSLAAWEGGVRPEGLFSYWKAIAAQPGESRAMPLVDDGVLMDLFERLADDERPQRIAFRFVLGLILMRKKRLKLVGRAEPRDGAPERWQLQPRPAAAGAEPGPPLELVNPQLTEDDLRELTEQLGEILQAEL
jgi:hypothetical protein